MAVRTPKTPPPKATRRISPLMRVMISAVLLAFAIFTVQYKKSLPQDKSAATAAKGASNKPFPATAPSSEGGTRFGWVPKIPDAQLENIRTKQTRDEISYGFSFHTAREFGEVLSFYGDQLQKEGFKVELKVDAGQNKGAHENAGQIHAASPDGARSLDVIASKADSGAEIGVMAVQR
jgi:hypothetical protein